MTAVITTTHCATFLMRCKCDFTWAIPWPGHSRQDGGLPQFILKHWRSICLSILLCSTQYNLPLSYWRNFWWAATLRVHWQPGPSTGGSISTIGATWFEPWWQWEVSAHHLSGWAKTYDWCCCSFHLKAPAALARNIIGAAWLRLFQGHLYFQFHPWISLNLINPISSPAKFFQLLI